MGIVASHVEIVSRDWLLSHGIRIASILVVAVLVSEVGRFTARRAMRKMKRVPGLARVGSAQRATTLGLVASRTIRLIIWTIAVLAALGEVGVNLAPLIAGAGIAGLAVGFGAQTLVRDVISGAFILVEGQFFLGDEVEMVTADAKVSGTVEGLTLRVTTVRARDGTLHFVPNGSIQIVGNKTRATKAKRRKRPGRTSTSRSR
ncbi:MAG: mechanosensitive ion channel family protein [Actinomycetota bacterium]